MTARPPTSDPEAHRLFLLGRYAWNQRTREKLEEAIGYYSGATERDPRFALAYAGLAEAYINKVNFHYMPVATGLANAERAAETAIALDSSVADGYAALGFALVASGKSTPEVYVRAESLFNRAIALNPSLAVAHHYKAIMLTGLGDWPRRGADAADTRARSALASRECHAGHRLRRGGRLPEARVQLRRRSRSIPISLSRRPISARSKQHSAIRPRRCVCSDRRMAARGVPGRAAVAGVHLSGDRPRSAGASAARRGARGRTDPGVVVELRRDARRDGGAGQRVRHPRADEREQKSRDIDTDMRANPLLREFRSDPRFTAIMARRVEGLRR